MYNLIIKLKKIPLKKLLVRAASALSCIGMKVLRNAVTPTPCFLLQKLGAIHPIEYFGEIKLSSYYSPVGLAVWSSAALEQSLGFAGASCHSAPRAPMYLWVGWVSLAGIGVSAGRKEKAGHISCSCGRQAEGAAFPAFTSRAFGKGPGWQQLPVISNLAALGPSLIHNSKLLSFPFMVPTSHRLLQALLMLELVFQDQNYCSLWSHRLIFLSESS